MRVLIYGWRNLWRNRRRTLVSLAAVTASTALLMAGGGLMDGFNRHTVDNATKLVVGEAQVHAPGYLADRSLYKTVEDVDAVLEVAAENGIDAAARSYGYGLVSQGAKSAGALFWGVDPAAEKRAFDLPRHLLEGEFLADDPSRGMVLGRKLARSLDVSVGSELVLVVQGADGSLGNDLYTVTGILKAAGEALDRSAAIIHRDDFDELFVAGGRIHEVALNSWGRLPAEEVARIAAGAAPAGEARAWQELLPALSDMVNLFKGSMVLFEAIFFIAAGLGVMNTMLMATYDRIRELGVIKALGASPWRIVRDVSAEALVLGLLGTALGAFVGLVGTWYLQQNGIDTTAFAGETSVGGVAFDPVWRAHVSAIGVFRPVLGMWAVCVLAALYPATLAARLDPVKAMQHV